MVFRLYCAFSEANIWPKLPYNNQRIEERCWTLSGCQERGLCCRKISSLCLIKSACGAQDVQGGKGKDHQQELFRFGTRTSSTPCASAAAKPAFHLFRQPPRSGEGPERNHQGLDLMPIPCFTVLICRQVSPKSRIYQHCDDKQLRDSFLAMI